MKNCIFICVFNNVNYVNMLYILLESIFIYGKLTDETDILIYTSTPFMNMIKNSHLYCKYIKFEINDTYNSIDLAFKARLSLFNLVSVSNYSKILYLDTDIIVKDDVKKVFDCCKHDILYVLEEGNIDSDTNWWGNELFGNEIHNYSDKNAFTSGILLFNNCETIQNLFTNINKDIINRPCRLAFHDQPYIVYNAFKYKLFDNQVLKDFVINHDENINSQMVIHHFPGGPGIHQHKILNIQRFKMHNFLNGMKHVTIFNNIRKTKKFINKHLLPIIMQCGEPLEGNIFMFHQTTTYTDMFINKVGNVSNMVLNCNIQNVMEIGFNSGFSTLLMLFSNPTMKITCFDLGEHTYTMPCFNILKQKFGDRINIIIGDSTKTLKSVNEVYDLIHIDGGHSIEVATNDITNSYRLSKKGTILIMDDYDFYHLHQLWDKYVIEYNLKPLNINTYNTPYHDIKYVITQ